MSQRPPEEWTEAFVALETSADWQTLDHELDVLRRARTAEYQRYRLGYLHARAKIVTGDWAGATAALEPFLAEGDPLRDLALHYHALAAQRAGNRVQASRDREQLISQFSQARYRDEAIVEESEDLRRHAGATTLAAFVRRVGDSGGAVRRRDLGARLVEAQLEEGIVDEASRAGVALLHESTADDAADRLSRVLDRPEILSRVGPTDWVLIGEAARSHRHFDRAVALLSRAAPQLPQRRDDLLFAIGRAQFGAEEYAAAEKTYLDGAVHANSADARATFFFHASRCAQLLGDDGRALEHMTRAIGVAAPPAPRRRKSRSRTRVSHRSISATHLPAVSAALTQRLRTRLSQRRFADATADLRLLAARFPQSDALNEGRLAYALAMIAAGRLAEARRQLDRIEPPAGLTAAEVAYWRARTLETERPDEAIESYLEVLRADAPTHFAVFARRRLEEARWKGPRARAVQHFDAEVARLVVSGDVEGPRILQTERILLTPRPGAGPALERLRGLYERLPRYREILELSPVPFPKLPVAIDGTEPFPRLELLLALGLFDDAADLIVERYPLQPPSSALTRAIALTRAGAPRGAIQAMEVLMRGVPSDYVPELLPRVVREPLYPHPFREVIESSARRFGIEPRLVLAIMREESRFEPRAKSVAAARGLLQLIIGTAKEIGRQIGFREIAPEDLYDPAVAVPLGTKYLAELSQRFSGDPYKIAAAYNAGPNQARLWSRLAPPMGDDAFLSSINFDETKNYVRKVLNSYERYGDIEMSMRSHAGGDGPRNGVE